MKKGILDPMPFKLAVFMLAIGILIGSIFILTATLVEFSNGQTVLLNFDETISKLEGESTGFLFLGLFMYFCALVGSYYTVYHIIHRKEKDSQFE